jgi:oligopeptide/dipeptide ABC transporter ATP-binding protein
MRQRVMIAMALTTKPDILIADEPTTALDVTVQAQILSLLKEIQKETKMAIILISHDLGVVAGVADRVLVMYAGRVMEQGKSEDLFYQMQHPYTHALLRSTPRIDIPQGKLPTITGMPPDPTVIQTGCPFFERCTHRLELCQHSFPKLKNFPDHHEVYCHLEGLPL